MRIFGTLVIWGWSKPYLELSDFPENWNGKSRAHSMYGCTDLFTEIRKNVRNPDSVHPYMTILTHVRINVNPYMGIRTLESVHPYILRGLLYKNGLFSSFFSYFFCFLPIFSKFSRFAQIYNIYSMISNEFLII